MNYSEFICEVKNNIQNYLPEYDIKEIKIEEVIKNNGLVNNGLVIILENENVFPSIYLEFYYGLYKDNASIDEVLEAIACQYKESRENMPVDRCYEVDLESVRDNVFVKLVNYHKNSEMLELCPHKKFLDMAITYRFLVSNDERGISSAMIMNKDMSKWNFSVDDLHEMSMKNTRRLFPVKCERLDEMLKSFPEMIDEVPENSVLYVLSNIQGINGAHYMLYDEVIDEFARRFNKDIYILPSSVHEILLLPVEETMKISDLRSMVEEVNSFVVSDIDFLSDNVYIYDINKKKITV